MASVGGGGEKISNDVFQTKHIQHLYNEFRDENQMLLLLHEMGAEM
jgi:hypothetical protein